jgi:response regulator RpfG family c-di-GMP phosphodiesterase
MISDFFDGMRTGRVYSDPLDYDGIASRMLSLAGTAFNPALTENFLQLTSAAQTSPLVKSPGESG